MGLSDQLQKLITEHGSAAILRDHLALFKDQVNILEKKATTLESENELLKTANEQLKSEAANLRIANNELAAKIKEYENPQNKKDLIDEPKVKILALLAQYSTDDEIESNDIAAQCNMSPQATQFHLEELQASQLIDASYYVGRSPTWYIVQEGRRYLMKRGLL